MNPLPRQHRTRTIDVWSVPLAQIEREGDTLSIQVKTPKGIVGMVLPVDAARDLLLLLPDATAITPPGPLARYEDLEGETQA